MCGLAGVFGISNLKPKVVSTTGYQSYLSKQTDTELSNFNTLLHISQLRGSDSSGIMFLPEDKGSPVVIKDTVTSATMLETSKYKRVSGSDNWNHIIGHSRAGTMGGQTFEAAHPHQHGPITLVHNGTVMTYRTVIKDTPIEVVSDSSAIAWQLSQLQPTEVSEFLNKMPAFGAIIWFDARDNSLNIAKDDSRSLYWTAPRKNKVPHTCGYISSQAAALGFVLPDGHTIKEVPKNTHFKIIDNNIRVAGTWKTYVAPVVALPQFNRTYNYPTGASMYGNACDLDDYELGNTSVLQAISTPDHLSAGHILRVGRVKDRGVNLPYKGTYTCPIDKRTYELIVEQPPLSLIEAGMDLCDNGGLVKIRYTSGNIIYAKVSG